jgi:hypothetical protein
LPFRKTLYNFNIDFCLTIVNKKYLRKYLLSPSKSFPRSSLPKPLLQSPPPKNPKQPKERPKSLLKMELSSFPPLSFPPAHPPEQPAASESKKLRLR